MAEYNNDGEKGKGKTFEVSFGPELSRKIEAISDKKDISPETFIKENTVQHIEWHQAKNVLREACQDGRLKSESRVCRHIENKEHEYHQGF